MKRLATFLLLIALSATCQTSIAWSMPSKENTRIGENTREAKKAARHQQKLNKKAYKKQRKAMKKEQRAQRKSAKQQQHRYK